MVQEVLRIKEEMTQVTTTQTARRTQNVAKTWSRPEEDVIKINCGAAWCPNAKHGGTGAIARDRWGIVVGDSHRMTVGESLDEIEVEAACGLRLHIGGPMSSWSRAPQM